MADLSSRVKRVISEHMGVPIEKVTDNATFIDDIGVHDSLDRLNLLMAIEEEFEVEILDEDAELILTVGDAVRELEKRLS